MTDLLQEPAGARSDMRRALEALVVDNRDLEHLEELLNPFNIFEAVGVTRQELRHSQFLAFLLDPAAAHGLGDRLARRLLQTAIRGSDTGSVSAVQLDLWDLSQLEVRREWRGIDILILDRLHEFAVIVENKIFTGEHDDQLRRYWTEVESRYTNWRIVGLYLSPDGSPAEGDDRYLAVGYEEICSTLERFLGAQGSTIGDEVRIAIQHYTQLLRRHVVENSEVVQLSQQIYAKHRAALDLIFEHRPDQQNQMKELLEGLVKSDDQFVLDHSTKQYVRFALRGWDSAPRLREGKGWTPSGRMLLFEFTNLPERLTLGLVLGPGPEDTRQKLFDVATHTRPFKPYGKALYQKWNHVWTHQILSRQRFTESSFEELGPIVEEEWLRLRSGVIAELDRAVTAEQWLWAAREA